MSENLVYFLNRVYFLGIGFIIKYKTFYFMNIYNFRPELSVNDLIAHGIRVEMDCSNENVSASFNRQCLICEFQC